MEEKEAKELEKEVAETVHDKRLKRKVDRSLLVALVAVVISLVGTFVSIYEAQIMREQQNLLAEQKSADAWPFMKGQALVDYQNDSTVIISYQLSNKGIGPAILGDVRYLFDGKDCESYSIGDSVAVQVDSLFLVSKYQNIQIDSAVFQPSEGYAIFTLTLRAKKKEYVKYINQVANHLSVEFCYCSVYGDCWYRGPHLSPEKREECKSYLSY